MKRSTAAGFAALVIAAASIASYDRVWNPLQSRESPGRTAVVGFAQRRISFEPNRGQTDSQVRFLARGARYTLFLTAGEAVLSLAAKRTEDSAPSRHRGRILGGAASVSDPPRQSVVLRMKLAEANPAPDVFGQNPLPARSNYLLGNDPARWHTDVPHYSAVRYSEVYPGIDLVYYGNPGELEFDFVVAPGADPGSIRLRFDGQSALKMRAGGEMGLAVGDGEIRLRKPVVYQETAGVRREIDASYRLHDNGDAGFTIGAYNRSQPLVVDPVLAYSTFFGGIAEDRIYGIAMDAAGNTYVTGETNSVDFPSASPMQAALAGGVDAFVAKLNSSGSGLVYSTYLGGANDDASFAIAVDAAGTAFLTGGTESANFPTVNPIQPAFGGLGDVFVSRLNAGGSALIFSTYLGGNGPVGDTGYAIALDTAGDPYVTGVADSATFPTTVGAFDRTLSVADAFVTKLNAAGTSLLYSTFLGGFGITIGTGIAVDASRNTYITGLTVELIPNTFPLASPFQPVPGGGTCSGSPCPDAFVTKLNAEGSALVYSTFLGGNNDDEAYAIKVDSTGSAYVTGYATSTDFPVTNALQPVKGTGFDAFVARLTSSGSALMFSTFMGGGGGEIGLALALGPAGIAYVSGQTGSNAFPVLNPLQQFRAGQFDAFVAALSTSGGLIYSTYLGGASSEGANAIAVDSTGTAFVAGETSSPAFPTMSAFQSAYKVGTCGTAPNLFPCDDGFVTRISNPNPAPVLTSLAPASAGTGGTAFNLTLNGSNFAGASEVRWNGAPRPTSFVSSGRLIAVIPGSDIAVAGTAQVSVFTPTPGGGASVSLPFSISSTGAVPAFIGTSLVNGASFTGLPPAMGSIASLFGANLAASQAFATTLPLPTTLGGATVRVNGVAAGLFFASPGQINLQIPWEVMGLTQASITVTVDGIGSAPITVNLAVFDQQPRSAVTSALVTAGVSAIAPSIFTMNAQGTGQGAILLGNTDAIAAPAGSIPGRNAQPATRGGTIVIFCTGLGDVTNRPASAAPASGTVLSPTTSPATVTIGGMAATVDFAGLAPNFVGLYQVNARVPALATRGNAVPVRVSIGGSTSNTVTIAIQ